MNFYNQLTKIGQIKATHGIKGELKIWIDSQLELLEDLKNYQIFLEDHQKNIDVYNVEKFYNLNNKLIIKLKDIDNIDSAKKFINQNILVKKEDNIIGIVKTLINYSLLFENNIIGKVIEEMNNGAHELIKVKTTQGIEFWIPYVGEYILEVDENKKIISAINIERLM
ncbi:16S rRNA processing protein RimM [Spiroplasma gladiatoris]|uniref:Ribosome maturation factor RimM n=1 Tax=Spiroplasma gladiatoris TaxID=2143 RepID=A0A4P7AIG6_9MOLU|nr:ribosome maturation factor RimM [Spiroplasma gladiatoris]QBQ07538.1 16S rRNA processing protein RimM [Spiroplasma gladiatoris]